MKTLVLFAFMVFLSTLAFLSQQAVNDMAAQTGETAPTFTTQRELLTRYMSNNSYTLNTQTDDLMPTTSNSFIETVSVIIFPLIVFWKHFDKLFVAPIKSGRNASPKVISIVGNFAR